MFMVIFFEIVFYIYDLNLTSNAIYLLKNYI